MMGVPRDWDVAIREDRREPVTFVLGGTEFSVPSPLPGTAFLDYAAKGDQSVATVMSLILDWLDPEGDQAEVRERFRAAYRRSRGSVQVLLDLGQWLVEEAAARPTLPPSVSLPSPPRTGVRTSNGASPSKVGSRRQRTRSG